MNGMRMEDGAEQESREMTTHCTWDGAVATAVANKQQKNNPLINK